MELILEYGVDAALIIIFLATVLNSYRRGLLRCLLSLVCVIVALFAAFNYSQPAAEWTYDNLLSERIVSELDEAITEGFSSKTAADTVQQTIEAVPSFLLKQLDEFGIDTDALSKQIASLELSSQDTAEKISEQIIRPGALVLLKLLCYILIFVLVRFASGCIIGLIIKLPMPMLFKAANKWLGGAIGVVKGGVIVIALSLLLNALAGLAEPEFKLAVACENSRICTALNEFGIADLKEIEIDFENLFN
ncbi:MAG: CvpA family protein [Clostridia bacterium]|nr:CvpA family protein [Clostridia bacterium]